MTTPTQNTRITAAEWKARYAELCREYPDNPPVKALNRDDWSKIRQWEQFQYALTNPPHGRWRVVRMPRDHEEAFRATVAYVEGLAKSSHFRQK